MEGGAPSLPGRVRGQQLASWAGRRVETFFCKQANNGNKKNKENPTNLNDPDVGRMLLCNNHMDHKGVGDDGCRRL